MSKKTLPELNRLHVSMITYSPELTTKFLNYNTQIYFFFLYYFQIFYKKLFYYSINLWSNTFKNYFFEDIISLHERFQTYARINTDLIKKYNSQRRIFKLLTWWSNVYLFTLNSKIYLISTYFQFTPRTALHVKKKKWKKKNKKKVWGLW